MQRIIRVSCRRYFVAIHKTTLQRIIIANENASIYKSKELSFLLQSFYGNFISLPHQQRFCTSINRVTGYASDGRVLVSVGRRSSQLRHVLQTASVPATGPAHEQKRRAHEADESNVCGVYTFTLLHSFWHCYSLINWTSLCLKLRGLSPRANYTDRAAAAGQRSQCQLLRIEGCHVVSATDPHDR